jgi:hypothetical protein
VGKKDHILTIRKRVVKNLTKAKHILNRLWLKYKYRESSWDGNE